MISSAALCRKEWVVLLVRCRHFGLRKQLWSVMGLACRSDCDLVTCRRESGRAARQPSSRKHGRRRRLAAISSARPSPGGVTSVATKSSPTGPVLRCSQCFALLSGIARETGTPERMSSANFSQASAHRERLEGGSQAASALRAVERWSHNCSILGKSHASLAIQSFDRLLAVVKHDIA